MSAFSNTFGIRLVVGMVASTNVLKVFEYSKLVGLGNLNMVSQMQTIVQSLSASKVIELRKYISLMSKSSCCADALR